MKITISQIKRKLLPLLKRHGIKHAGVFGSYATGRQTKTSDIDILVEFESPIGFFDFIRLETFLSTLLQKKVDLVSAKAIKQGIRNEVLKDLIYV